MLNAEVLPVAWRSILTGGCIETGKEVWEGGANYYTVAQISVAGVDAANSLMAVKKLVFDDKKLTMAELKKALAANFEGEYQKVGKLCFEAPKHGNDIPEVNALLRRVNGVASARLRDAVWLAAVGSAADLNRRADHEPSHLLADRPPSTSTPTLQVAPPTVRTRPPA
jgi:pyruvate-formate lyase